MRKHQGTQRSDGSKSVLSPMMRRSSRRRRQRSEAEDKLVTQTPTAALRAYLLTDIDAKMNIPSSQPILGFSDNDDLKTIENGSQDSTKKEVMPEFHQTLPATGNVNFAQNEETALQAESPLSRFRKHKTKTEPAVMSKSSNHVALSNTATTKPTEKSRRHLARSLRKKINEAKSLRQTVGVKETCTEHQTKDRQNERVKGSKEMDPDYLTARHSSSLTFSPSAFSTSIQEHTPIPHEKPTIPSFRGKTSKSQKTLVQDLQPQKTVSSIDNAIVMTNAIVSIQRMWRQKQLHSRIRRKDKVLNQSEEPKADEVACINDKGCKAVIPLYTPVEKRKDQLQKPENHQAKSNLMKCESANASESTAILYPSYHPWSDHDLILLEEGRRIGQLYAPLCKSVSIDQNGGTLKRPQHVLQPIKTRQIALNREKRAPERQAHDFLWDHRVVALDSNPNDTTCMTSFDLLPLFSNPTRRIPRRGMIMMQQKRKPARVNLKFKKPIWKLSKRGTETRYLRVLVPGVTTCRMRQEMDSYAGGKEEMRLKLASDSLHFNTLEDKTKLSMVPFKILEADTSSKGFVVFSGSERTSNDDFRNDLISLGDLTLARSLLADKLHFHPDEIERHHDFIPLKMSGPLLQPSTQTLVKRRHKEPAVKIRDEAGIELSDFEKSPRLSCTPFIRNENSSVSNEKASLELPDRKKSTGNLLNAGTVIKRSTFDDTISHLDETKTRGSNSCASSMILCVGCDLRPFNCGLIPQHCRQRFL